MKAIREPIPIGGLGAAVQTGLGPATNQKSIGTTAVPITQVGTTSSANTTFTVTTGVDGTAWDLSTASAGMIAVTSDGYRGTITVVNDGADTITVGEWTTKEAGIPGTPVATSTIRIFKVIENSQSYVQALYANTNDVYIGASDVTTANGFPIAPGQVIGVTSPFLDEVYAVVASGTETIAWFRN